MERRRLLRCWWECKLVNHYGEQYGGFLKKLKIELSHDPTIPLLGIYLEKIIIQKDEGTSIFTVVLLTVA